MIKFKDFEKEKLPIRAFEVKSRTDPGAFYELYVFDDDNMKCMCSAGSHYKDCWHKELIRRFLNREVLTEKELNMFREIQINP